MVPKKLHPPLKDKDGAVIQPERPWPLSNNGNPSLCTREGLFGMLLNHKWTPVDLKGAYSEHLILCMQTILSKILAQDTLQIRTKAVGISLDHLMPRSKTLYHEMFHVLAPGSNLDVPYLFTMPRAVDKANSYYPPWPYDRRAWGYFDPRRDVCSAKECRLLALYDRCTSGATTDFGHDQWQGREGAMAVNNPESLMLFGVTNYMQRRGSMQWANGKSQPKGSRLRPLAPEFPDRKWYASREWKVAAG